jgi:peptide/nickel transport system substrate-binding protein
MGPATIKSIRYQVVSSNSMLDSLYTSAVDFAEPNAKPETQTELRGKKSEGLEFTTISTMGYGYIGINAGKIPSVYVRRAIMYCIDTQMTVSYYGNLASPIYRSMSKNSWAYPTGCSAYYPYIGDAIPSEAELENVDPDYVEYITKMGYSSGYTMTKEEQQAFIVWLLEDKAGYTLGANGIYANNGKNECKFEFTIAGQETDHPAYSAMFKAAQFLNEVGFSVKVRTDNDALSKLTTGSLTVWAAAWSSTIDPDMYQVYHKDSTATSVLNWGYTQIYNDTTKYAYKLNVNKFTQMLWIW